jgi:hypothetical protein
MRHTRMFTIAALVISAAAAIACRPKAVGTSAADGADTATNIVVDNRGFHDMTIYVIEGSARRRLGTATGLSKTRFPIPRTIVGNGREMQFLADPIGGSRNSVSHSIFVSPGDQVGLTITP